MRLHKVSILFSFFENRYRRCVISLSNILKCMAKTSINLRVVYPVATNCVVIKKTTTKLTNLALEVWGEINNSGRAGCTGCGWAKLTPHNILRALFHACAIFSQWIRASISPHPSSHPALKDHTQIRLSFDAITRRAEMSRSVNGLLMDKRP